MELCRYGIVPQLSKRGYCYEAAILLDVHDTNRKLLIRVPAFSALEIYLLITKLIPLCSLKACNGVKVLFLSFLTKTLDKDQWSAAHPNALLEGQAAPYPFYRRRDGPRAGLDVLKKIKLSCFCLKSNHDWLVIQPVAYWVCR